MTAAERYPAWLDEVAWNDDGLVCAIAQEASGGRVLMQAWMSREALFETTRSGYAVYWSRSKKRLWRKGERSGHLQRVVRLRLDCDGDALLLEVEQIGGIACHSGRASCFFRELDESGWRNRDAVLKSPEDIYRP